MAVVPAYLLAMGRVGVIKTAIVGGVPNGASAGSVGEEKHNLEALRIANVYPEHFVAFPTIDHRDPNRLAKVEKYVRLGAKGLKLYSGHSRFHTLPLDDPEMREVYEYCQTMSLPVILHVNVDLYQGELERVLDGFRGLSVVCPHLCLSTATPDRFGKLMAGHPNLFTDISFGHVEFLKQALLRISSQVERFRELFVEYQDRIFFGTDHVIDGAGDKTVEWIEKMTNVYKDLLEKDRYTFSGIQGEVLRGLSLAGDVLHRIYSSNFREFVV